MICRLKIQNFKRFKGATEFKLKPEGITFFAGGNNSGKSSLLQALAIWEFARSVIEINRGARAFLSDSDIQGVGLSAAEFSPIALPNLKHLWNNLHVSGGKQASGYTLRIRCEWRSQPNIPIDRYLEFGLAYSNDRLFLKCTSSNLASSDLIPRIAYLPPFAGIGPQEEKMSPAARKRWIGRGLAGAVMRNLIYDFWKQNCDERSSLKDARGRMTRSQLAQLRKSDSWEQLLKVMQEVFRIGISVKQFNELYHTAIEVAVWEGNLIKKQFRKKAGLPEKDIMVEGSGFLQWLSVYALALNKELNTLLLDEPDAHLHPALQGHLIHKLGQIARENKKQVLIATHSTTILSEARIDQIFRMEDKEYLKDERGRVSLFIGLGSQYAPRLDKLKRCKRLFLHDGPSDLEILQAWTKTLGFSWPENLVCWKYTKDREARAILFGELHSEITDLKCISIQDRDDYPLKKTNNNLTFDDLPAFNAKGLGLRRWRRRNIENYLLYPSAIARASNRTEDEVREFIRSVHALNITNKFKDSNCPQTLANTDGKDIITRSARSITAEYGVDFKQIADAMARDEIPDDAKTLIKQIIDFCK